MLFGAGRIGELAAQVEALGCRRALVLSTKEQRDAAERVVCSLGDRAGGIFAGAVMHTPTEVTETALATFADGNCDCTVAIGGGSTIGLGKAIALRTDAPQIVVPTTYAGSEVTPILGRRRAGRKTTPANARSAAGGRDLRRRSDDDPASEDDGDKRTQRDRTTPSRRSTPGTPIRSSPSWPRGHPALTRASRPSWNNRRIVTPRADAQYGAWLCGTYLGVVGMALHHKICHALGGAFDLPHAEMHAIVLPHVAAFNAVAAPEALDGVAPRNRRERCRTGLFDLEAPAAAFRARCARSGCRKMASSRAVELDHRIAVLEPARLSMRPRFIHCCNGR